MSATATSTLSTERTDRARALRRLWRGGPVMRLALLVLAAVVVVGLFGGVLAPYDPLAQDTANALAGPSLAHPLGTDYLGRDVLSRLLAGAPLSLSAAVLAMVVGFVLGVVPGMLSVFAPRPVEWFGLRLVDTLLALPFVLFAISFAGLLGNGLWPAMTAIGILLAPGFFRVARAAAVRVTSAQYVEAATLLGASAGWLVRRHVWRTVLPSVSVAAIGALGAALLVVSSLTFLGIGVEPPAPTWGGMLASDLEYLSQRPLGPSPPRWRSSSPSARSTSSPTPCATRPVRAPGARRLGARPTGARPLDADGRAPMSQLRESPASVAAPVGLPAGAARGSAASAPSFDEATLSVTPIVSVQSLVVSAIDGTPLVHGVGLDVRPGEAVGVVGESGSGKTLTCRALLGILPSGTTVTGGRVLVDGRDLTHAAESEWRALRGPRIGAVFQDPASYLNPSIRIGAQLEEVLRVTAKVPRRETRARARALLDDLGLRDVDLVLRRRVGELSGGMLQRVLIAMALAADPAVLIADEATTALDVTVQAELLDLLRRLRAERGLSLVLVSHDLAVVSQVCERVVVFQDGRIIEGGPTARVLRSPGHPYTRQLLSSHAQYGLERYLA
ncbi:ATP-binding cassette domain-containing protein [Microbacterium sp.]|uniref:ATP-binding cassette domain-containing protein n=1 Tax=Microbacterium sp. TaxID=51671 RepID=UPI0039E2563C